MGEIYFIPTDADAFFRNNPLEGHEPPATSASMTFWGSCLSCAEPTDHLEAYRPSYLDTGSGRRRTWELSLPMCSRCVRSAAREAQRRSWTRIVAGIVLALVAVGVALTVRSLAGLSDVGTVLVLGILLFSSLTFVLPPLVETVLRAVGTGESEVHSVEITFFADPRKGPGAEFLRLAIAHPAAASEFAARNPHAIAEATWNETYRSGARGC